MQKTNYNEARLRKSTDWWISNTHTFALAMPLMIHTKDGISMPIQKSVVKERKGYGWRVDAFLKSKQTDARKRE